MSLKDCKRLNQIIDIEYPFSDPFPPIQISQGMTRAMIFMHDIRYNHDMMMHNVSCLTDFVPDLQVKKVWFWALLGSPAIFLKRFKRFHCQQDATKIRPAI